MTKAIHEEMEKEGVDHEFISFENVPEEIIKGHFPHIYEKCLEEGYDILKEPAPIVPAQHYFMGGVHVDRDSETTMPHLYAVGETSCNGVHGKNRLASNSLLESLVFAKARRTKIELTQKGKEEHESITMQLVADKYIKMALEEDINSEDVSTNAVMPSTKRATYS